MQRLNKTQQITIMNKAIKHSVILGALCFAVHYFGASHLIGALAVGAGAFGLCYASKGACKK